MRTSRLLASGVLVALFLGLSLLSDSSARDVTWTASTEKPKNIGDATTSYSCSDRTGSTDCTGALNTCYQVTGYCIDPVTGGSTTCPLMKVMQHYNWGVCGVVAPPNLQCHQWPTYACASFSLRTDPQNTGNCNAFTVHHQCYKDLYYINACNP